MGVSVPTLGLWELEKVFPKHCYHAGITTFLGRKQASVKNRLTGSRFGPGFGFDFSWFDFPQPSQRPDCALVGWAGSPTTFLVVIFDGGDNSSSGFPLDVSSLGDQVLSFTRFPKL
jgi:hypothetical protein